MKSQGEKTTTEEKVVCSCDENVEAFHKKTNIFHYTLYYSSTQASIPTAMHTRNIIRNGLHLVHCFIVSQRWRFHFSDDGKRLFDGTLLQEVVELA